MSSGTSSLVGIAVGGLLAGLAACGGREPSPAVPGAPARDPAGVPAARAAEPAATKGEHACGANMSCGGKGDCSAGMKTPPPEGPPAPR